MKCAFLVALLFLVALAFGQNLIPNPGFDDLTDCPNEHGQISLAHPWVTATNGTPDVYNECSSTERISVPNAGISNDSYQVQISGGGYAGIFVFENFSYPGISEYIETPLTIELQTNVQYYIRFYASPDITLTDNNWIFTDAIGLALSDTFYYEELVPHLSSSLEPVVENIGKVITDTIGWTEVNGCYKAKGGEKYAIIGNFRSESETTVVAANPAIYNHVSYFYIEDVLIKAFDPLPDTLLLCDGQPEILNAAFLDAAYLWNTGDTDSILLAQNSGVYTVEAFMEKCVLTDTVVVLDTRDTNGFQADTTICSDEPITITAPLPGSYYWSDGSRAREIQVSSSGIYSVTISNECGQFSFSTQVEAMDCECNVFVPNAISPNGDGINDALQVYFGCDYEYRILRFAVFDRWGGQMYTSGEGETPVWDGTAHGKPLPKGTYVWYLEYETLRNGLPEKNLEKGEVSLIR